MAGPLDGSVRNSLANAKLEKVRVGVAIVDCNSRETLASIKATELYAPASNLKLLTSGVAVSILKDFEFKTGFSVTADGKLIIKGGGDPALCDPKLLLEQGWSVERFLARIVDAARAAKIAQGSITEVIVDDRIFERDTNGGAPVHSSWPKEQLNQWYCAPVSGLNFFTNVIEIRATPAERVGNKPSVATEPSAPWLINLDLASTRTVKDTGSKLWAQQDTSGAAGGGAAGALTFKIFGDVQLDNGRTPPVKVDVTVAQPGLLLGRLVARAMWEAGLATPTRGGMPVRVATDNEDLVAPEAAPFAVITTPLAAAMRRCNVDSQNLYAECLLKRTAFEVTQQPGSWATGSQVVTMRLTEKLGQEAQSIRIVDGSGMSKENQITPMVMTHWLTALKQDPSVGEAFLASMARVDDKESKVSKRFIDHRFRGTVYAKTGFIKNVVTLSGYVVNGEHAVAYSILANDVGGNITHVREFQKDVLVEIDNWLAR